MKDHHKEGITDARRDLQAILRAVQSSLDTVQAKTVGGSGPSIRHALTVLSGRVIAAAFKAKEIK